MEVEPLSIEKQMDSLRYCIVEQSAELTAIFRALYPECPAYPGIPNTCEDMCDCFAATNLAEQVARLAEAHKALPATPTSPPLLPKGWTVAHMFDKRWEATTPRGDYVMTLHHDGALSAVWTDEPGAADAMRYLLALRDAYLAALPPQGEG